MQHFDSDYGEQLIERISQIPEDAVPQWGTMNRKDLIEHFIWALRHTIGRSTTVPDFSNWFSRIVLKHLALSGLFGIPKNMRLPSQFTDRGISSQEPGDIETLQAIIEEYLHLVQADELKPAPHAFFGPLDVDQWDKIHVQHFEHHLKQFEK